MILSKAMPVSVFVLGSLLAGCSEPADILGKPDPDACSTALPAGQFEDAAKIGEFNEGIAFSQEDRLFVSSTKTLWEVSPDKTATKFADVEDALGLAFLKDKLMVAGLGVDKIFSIDTAGNSALYAEGVSSPNFLATTPWGTVLVASDADNNSVIVELTPAGPVTWSTDVLSPNGMAFSEDGKTLYVVTTFETDPGFYRIPILSGNKAGKAELVTRFKGYPTPDGIALAADGSVYVALNIVGELARVKPDTGEIEIVARGLTFPASVAFGRGKFDRCSLYVTELFGKNVHRISVGVQGGKIFY